MSTASGQRIRRAAGLSRASKESGRSYPWPRATQQPSRLAGVGYRPSSTEQCRPETRMTAPATLCCRCWQHNPRAALSMPWPARYVLEQGQAHAAQLLDFVSEPTWWPRICSTRPGYRLLVRQLTSPGTVRSEFNDLAKHLRSPTPMSSSLMIRSRSSRRVGSPRGNRRPL